MKYRRLFVVWGVAICAWFAAQNSLHAQGTQFTYQGRLLVNGAGVSGLYDMTFTLRPALTGTNQTGPIITNLFVAVTNGLFTTALDFGNFFYINPLWLEVGVRTNGGNGAFSILTPRQPITSAPYAVQSLTTANFLGSVNDSQLSANVPLLNGNPTFTGTVTISNTASKFNGTFAGAASGTFSGAASGTFTGTTTGTNNGKFVGDGAGVTNLNVTNLVGLVQSNPNWQLIQGTSQAAVSGNNYLGTNNAQTTLTLPGSPGVGSTIWLAGSGAAGWVISQSGSQSIITAPFGLGAGQNWNVSYNSSQSWHAVCSSANGLRVAAAYGTGIIYYSADGGQTWTASDSASQNWSTIACSADGMRMVAAPNNAANYVYTSVNGGAHWTQQTGGLPTSTFHSVASSADGIDLVAATDSGLGPLYTSSNGGTNWTSRVTGQNWVGVASSSNGTRIAAAAANGMVYTSVNSGVTWTSNSIASGTCTGIASSADGSKLAVTLSGGSTGYIYTSGDGGNSWTPRASLQSWTCITSSADGLKLAAAYSLGLIYTSSDGGQTWVQRTNGLVPSGQAWSAITSAADGSRLFATVSIGQIYGSIASTTAGATGSLSGSQYSNVQLQYIGNNQWMPLNFNGTFTGN